MLLTIVSFFVRSLCILVASPSPFFLLLFANPLSVVVHSVVSFIVAIGGSSGLVSNRSPSLRMTFYPLVTCGEVPPMEILAALAVVVAHRLEILTGEVRIPLRLHVLCFNNPFSPFLRIFEWVS